MKRKESFKEYCLSKKKTSLLDEWSYEDNQIGPEEVSTGNSRVKIVWKCSRGHKWEAPVSNRIKGHGCPYCAHHWPIVGETDLATTNPELASEWNYQKNGDLLPTMVLAGSNRKVWWKCSKGHEWEALITNRSKGRGCPYCSKAKATSIPEKAILFYLRQLFPDCIGNYLIPGAHQKEIDVFIPSLNLGVEYDGFAWHRNAKRDEAKDALCKRLGITLIRIREKGCPKLSTDSITIDCPPPSNNLTNFGPTLGSLLKEVAGRSGATRLPDIDLARDYIHIIELMDFSELENSLAKRFPSIAAEWDYEKNGSITPEMVSAGSPKRVWWRCSLGHEWRAQISNRTNSSNRTSCPYCSNKKVLPGFNDLATTNPTVAAEWDWEANAPLLPTQVTARTGKKVFWICSKGHRWKATIASRMTSGCPVCANKKVETGVNDFATKYPSLLNEWDYDHNEIPPDKVNYNSTKKVQWVCSKCHERYVQTPYNRAHRHGCPFCANQSIRVGHNDLATTDPDIAADWDYEKNYPITPQQVVRGSMRIVWWHCPKGHSYRAPIYNRTKSKGRNACTVCFPKNGLVVRGVNDLESNNPELAAQWNYARNDSLLPSQVSKSSGKKVWWICSKGHEWQAAVSNRNSKSNKTGCPICSGAKIVQGINDLATLYPALMLDWDYEKNTVDPKTISPGSAKKVYWKCHVCGKEWSAVINSRARGGFGCPSCGHKRSHKKR